MKILDFTLNAENRDSAPQLLGPDQGGAAAWSATVNGRFINGVWTATDGEIPMYPTTGGPAGPILYARTALSVAGTYRAIYVTNAGIGIYDGVHHDVTPPGWVAPSPFKITATVLNSIPVLNAPPNEPYSLDLLTFTPAAKLPGWPAGEYCEAMVAYRYYLVACGITSAGNDWDQLVRWSDAAEPGTLPQTWAPAPDNDAGDLVLSDVPGGILAARQMIDSVVIYKASGAFLLQWVGGASIMQRRFLFSNLGVVNPRAVTTLEKEHACIIPGDIVVHNGAEFRSIINGRFRRWFFDRVPASLWPFVAIHYDPIAAEVWAAYPAVGSAVLTEALVWNRFDDTITVRTFTPCNDLFWSQIPAPRKEWGAANFAWNNSGSASWASVGGTASGTAMLGCLAALDGTVRVIALDASDPALIQSRALNPTTSYCERVGIPVPTTARRSLVKRLRPRIRGANGATVNVSVGMHESPDDPVTWQAPRAWVIGSTRDVPVLLSGRYAAIRVEATGVRFSVEGVGIEFTQQGAV